MMTETESCLRNVVLCNIHRTVFSGEDRTMDNVQQNNICINVPSLQTFRSYSFNVLAPDSSLLWSPEIA
jgi:hypothetical protein